MIITMAKWIMFTILIFSVFASKKVTFLQHRNRRESLVNPSDCLMVINTNLTDKLNDAAKKGDKKGVKLVLDTFHKIEENEIFIQFLLKGNNKNITALILASSYGHETIVKMLLNVFNEEEKENLIEYVMQESYLNFTALHIATQNGHTEVVKLLLNVFTKEEDKDEVYLIEYAKKKDKTELTDCLRKLLNSFKEKDKLIEYVMKEDAQKRTALHYASQNGHEQIVNSLLDVFDKQHKEKLIQFLMQEDMKKDTALHFAFHNGYEKIVNTLCDIFGKNQNRQLIKYLTKKNELKYICSFRWHFNMEQKNNC